MIAIWECLSLWNKHDDDDDDAIWESLKLQNKCLDFHFFFPFSNDMKKQIGCNLLKKSKIHIILLNVNRVLRIGL
jgi:hypothetical protein